MDKITALKQHLFAKRKAQIKQAHTREQDKQKRAIRAKRERLKAITETCTKLRAERLRRRRDGRTKDL